MAFSRDEVRYLIANSETIEPVTMELALTKKSLISDMEILKREFDDFARPIAELARARRSGKLPAYWMMDSDAAQQATSLEVAAIRAHRIKSVLGKKAVVHDVTCSIGTEGYACHAEGLKYIGSDLDMSRIEMARFNVPEIAGRFFIADALRPTSNPDVVIADPARRSGGRRIANPADLMPPLPDLVEAWKGTPMAVKCAPGLDFSEWDGLVSLVSVDGGVKEACLYTPEFVESGERREAFVVRGGGEIDHLTDAMPSAEELQGEPGKYIIDPDGAVVRAGLVRQFAVREGLWMLDERIAYLTGDRIPAGYSGFEYLETVPLKKLRSALGTYNVGALEILVRGVDVDPDELRKKLKLKGKKSMAVVITRIGTQGVALICKKREVSST